MKKSPTQKDTSAWIILVWGAFAASIVLAGVGIVNLPADDWKRGYMAMGMLFTLGSTFSLVKTMRDNQHRRIDTGAWTMQVWIAFAISLLMTTIGLWNLDLGKMEGAPWVKGFMGIALFMMMMMAFALAKTVRDNQPTFIDELGMDKDGDGFVSRTEAQASPKMAKAFDAMDANKDGKLSPAEIRAFQDAKQASVAAVK